MPGKEPDFLKYGNPKMRKEVQAVIDKLYGNDFLKISDLSRDLLSRLLSGLMSGTGEALDISGFTPEEMENLLATLREALEKLGKSGGSGEEIIKILLHNLIIAVLGMNKSVKDELVQINEKKQKEMKDLISKIVNYENYKITSPQQIAGEVLTQKPIEKTDLLARQNVPHRPLGKGGPGMGM